MTNLIIIFKEPKPECTTDSECSNDKACINYACKNPCQESPTTCARNALCYVQKHRSVCVCRDGMTGNAQIQCVESKNYYSINILSLSLNNYFTNSSWLPR